MARLSSTRRAKSSENRVSYSRVIQREPTIHRTHTEQHISGREPSSRRSNSSLKYGTKRYDVSGRESSVMVSLEMRLLQWYMVCDCAMFVRRTQFVALCQTQKNS